MKWRCWPELQSHLMLIWGRICFQAHSGCWQNSVHCSQDRRLQFLAGCQLGSPLAPKGHLLFLAMWGSPKWWIVSWKSTREWELPHKLIISTSFLTWLCTCNHIHLVTFGHTHTQREGTTQGGEYKETRIMGAIIIVCPLHHPWAYNLQVHKGMCVRILGLPRWLKW